MVTLGDKINRFEKLTKDIHEAEEMLTNYTRERDSLRKEILDESPALRELFGASKTQRRATRQVRGRALIPKMNAARAAKSQAMDRDTTDFVARSLGVTGQRGVKVTASHLAKYLKCGDNSAFSRLRRAEQRGCLIREVIGGFGKFKIGFSLAPKANETAA